MPACKSSGQVCWLCTGGGVIRTGAEERLIVCGMYEGSGVSDTQPSSTAEMVDMLAGLPGIERRTLTAADIDAAVAEFGPIIEAALCQIEKEEERER